MKIGNKKGTGGRAEAGAQGEGGGGVEEQKEEEEQGPAGQRCVREAHEAHPAHQAHSAMLMLDCPNDFHRENSSFLAFKKTRYTGMDQRTNGRTDRRTRPHLEMQGRI